MLKEHDIQDIQKNAIDIKSIDDILYDIILDTLQDKDQNYANKLHKLYDKQKALKALNNLINDGTLKIDPIATTESITQKKNEIYSELASSIEQKLFDTVLKEYDTNNKLEQNVDFKVDQCLSNLISESNKIIQLQHSKIDSNNSNKIDEIKYFQYLQKTLQTLKTNNTDDAIKQLNAKIQDLHAYIEHNKTLLNSFDRKQTTEFSFADSGVNEQDKQGSFSFADSVDEQINIFDISSIDKKEEQDFNLNEYREALKTNIDNMTKLDQLLTIKMYIADFRIKKPRSIEEVEKNTQSKSHFTQFIANICDMSQAMPRKKEIRQEYKEMRIDSILPYIENKILKIEQEKNNLYNKLNKKQEALNKNLKSIGIAKGDNNNAIISSLLKDMKKRLHETNPIKKITQRFLHFIRLKNTTYKTQIQQIDEIQQNMLQIRQLEVKIQKKKTQLVPLGQKKDNIVTLMAERDSVIKNHNISVDHVDKIIGFIKVSLADIKSKYSFESFEHLKTRQVLETKLETTKQEIQKMNILSKLANAIFSSCGLTTSYHEKIKKLDQQITEINQQLSGIENSTMNEKQLLDKDLKKLVTFKEKLKTRDPEIVKTAMMDYIKQCKNGKSKMVDIFGVPQKVNIFGVPQKVKLDEILPMYSTLTLIKELSEDQKRNVDQKRNIVVEVEQKQNANVPIDKQAKEIKVKQSEQDVKQNIKKQQEKSEKYRNLSGQAYYKNCSRNSIRGR